MSADDLGGKRRPLKGRLLVLAAAALAGLALGAGAWAWRSTQELPSLPVQAASGQPAIGGAFQLVDQAGRPVDQRLLQGKWTAVFFGYTYCPDFCPATLQTLQAAAGELGPRAEDLQVVFITVDPTRDTPEALRSYLAGFQFPGGVHGLSGTPAQVESAAKAWKVYFRKRGDGPDYAVDHTTAIFLMNPQGGFDRPLTHGLDPRQMASQIQAAMKV